MPLAAELPTIDDRTYEDIVAEIRTRIPRYAPEWTDLNESDPGMTFIELFAWLSDMLLYRLGKVPQLNYIKFLELLGIELLPAEPARAEITFPVRPDFSAPYVIVPLRTQLQAEESDEQGPILFETDRALVALRSRLASVLMSTRGGTLADLTRDNDEPERGFQPFGPLASQDSALLLGFTEPLPQVQIDVAVWVPVAEAGSHAVSCDVPATAQYPPAEIAWEFWNGSLWDRVAALNDQTLALTRSGQIVLRPPPVGAMRAVQLGPVADNRYWLRARLARASYEKPPRLLAIRMNTVTATQAETIRDEVLGGSDGRPHQTMQLNSSPVLAGSLQLEVDEGRGPKRWEVRPDFLDSSPTAQHCVLNRTTGMIQFGDGLRHGEIPAANPQNTTGNIVAREYRVGGGPRGNVAARSLTTLLTPVAGIDEDNVGNLRPAYGGRGEESFAQAQDRARRSLKSKCRAVTAEDFEQLATQAANIKRAKALPGTHPRYPGITVPGAVTVIVVPDSDQPNPQPSEGTLRTVCEYLDQRRLLTTELYVARPTYCLVEITGKVIARDNADLAEVTTAIEQSLLRYLHPLVGGEDGRGWPFGGDVFYSRVSQRIFSVPGVDRIESLELLADGQTCGPCSDVIVDAGVLVYSTRHGRLEVGYSQLM
jgi:predicted phage baseplate assembly protein